MKPMTGGQSTTMAVASVSIREEFGWKYTGHHPLDVWTKGYGVIEDRLLMSRNLSGSSPPTVESLSKLLGSLDGHFALAATGPGWAFAAVDFVRSIPLAWGQSLTGFVIDDQADRLRRRLKIEKINSDAATAIALAGYTVDTATLYAGINQLGPGEFVLFTAGSEPQLHRYYRYRPWRHDKPDFHFPTARKTLAEVTLALIDKMMRGVGDRLLIVPLSAGRDSRLILSAAHHLGYRNIRTFSYGIPGNYESIASRAIVERLGLPWRFVPTGVKMMRRHFHSSVYSNYLDYSDSLQAVPFVQDLPQLAALKQEGYVPDDAVIANGNSGDYISGNHVVPAMQEISSNLNVEYRIARICHALLDKHFRLWRALRTPDRYAQLTAQIRRSIKRAGAVLGDPRDDYGIYEYEEFQDRQCKYVIGGQRIYEFLGHEWRLPLWDKVYLDYFENIPLEGKAGQRLYADMLDSENWGGVWRDMPINRKSIRPHWIRPIRWLARIAHAPVGREAWHNFERRYFQFWMENGSQSAIKKYLDVAFDSRGARHGLSWLTEKYLGRHGLFYDGNTRVSKPDMA